MDLFELISRAFVERDQWRNTARRAQAENEELARENDMFRAELAKVPKAAVEAMEIADRVQQHPARSYYEAEQPSPNKSNHAPFVRDPTLAES